MDRLINHKGSFLFIGLILVLGLMLQGCVNTSLSMINANVDRDVYATKHEITLLLNDKTLTEEDRNEQLYSALNMACQWNIEIVKLILDMGISPNYPNNNPDVNNAHGALFSSIKSQQYDIAKLLIEYGANVNGTIGTEGSFSAFYPLTDAVYWQREPFVQLLLDAGANPNIESIPLKIAQLNKNKTIEKMLLDAGAVLEPTEAQMFAHLQPEYQQKTAKYKLALALEQDDVETFSQLLSDSPSLRQVQEGEKAWVSQAIDNNAPNILRWIYSTDDMAKIDEQINRDEAFKYVIRMENAELLSVLLELMPTRKHVTSFKEIAISQSSIDLLTILFEHKPGIGYVDESFWLLTEAVEQPNTQITKMLLKQGAQINHLVAGDPQNHIVKALSAGQLKQAELLLDNGAVDFADAEFEETALYYAIKRKQQPIAVKLFQSRENITDSQRNWIYNYALLNGQNELANIADNGKVTVNNTSNDKGENLIHLAVRNQNLAQLNKFIAQGIDFNQANNAGMTPLYLSAQNGFTQGVSRLLALGADPFAHTQRGASPISAAAAAQRTEVVDILLPLYEQDSQHAKDLASLLVKATKNQQVPMMRKLLAMGVSADTKTNRGDTLLYMAVDDELRYDVVKTLLAAGADPAIESTGGNYSYPMISAIAGWGETSHVKLMIAAGADINITNQYGNNGMDLLIQAGGMNWDRLQTFRAMGGWPATEASHFAKVDENGYIDDSNAWASMSINALNSLNAKLARETQKMEAQFQANIRRAKLLQKEQRALEQAKLEASVRRQVAQQQLVQQQQAQQQLAEQQSVLVAKTHSSIPANTKQSAAPTKAAARGSTSTQVASNKRDQQSPPKKPTVIEPKPVENSASWLSTIADVEGGNELSGSLTKHNLKVGSVVIDKLEVKFNVSGLGGEPVVRGIWRWESQESAQQRLPSQMAVLVKVSSGRSYGYVKLSPTVPKANADYGSNTPGSPSWNGVVCSYSGFEKRDCFTKDQARWLLKTGRVTDFVLTHQ
ncbi:ankyrin repeat domain-containing protein [Shewanella maritima]|uniref:ankyrin repeat domain-containing protein n=1 Tax=Shewanella maritima TaxID=2520507 RepID=UPI003734CB80